MSQNDKFFYRTSKTPFVYSEVKPARLIRWNPEYDLELDEEVEHYQDLRLSMSKLGVRNNSRPTSNAYESIKPIIREVFIEHYGFAIKYLHNSQLGDGEYYIIKRSKDWFIARYYSLDEKRKFRVEIDFRDGVEYFSVSACTEHGHKYRRDTRNHGEVVTMETFQRFLYITTQFLHDSDSFQVHVEDYIRDIKSLTRGEDISGDFILSKEKYFDEILQQLGSRTKALEQQLIENDSDAAPERAKLRGELKGLEYAISTIKKYC